jgi:xanthine dehydrogenase accessory factor
MKTLFQQMLRLVADNRSFALISIIDSSGSSSRGPGAHMIVCDEGRIWGTIGGSLSEHLALEKAKALMAKRGGRQVDKYNAANTDARCGGEIVVFSQYIDAATPGLCAFIEKALSRFSEKDETWLVMGITGLSNKNIHHRVTRSFTEKKAKNILKLRETPCSPWLNSYLLDSPGPSLCLAAKDGILSALCQEPDDTFPLLKNECACLEQNGKKWFSQPLTQAGFVYIFGGGHVAQELVPLLSRLGFRCLVFDDREEFAKTELFPDAVKSIRGDFAHIRDSLCLEAVDYAVIVTHGHQWDFEAEAFALQSEARYIGVIGSKAKHAFIRERLLAVGFTDAQIHAPRVHAPIGISIGSKSPAELAVSIAAELIQIRNGASIDFQKPNVEILPK